MEKMYLSPSIEVIEVEVEEGFAASGSETSVIGQSNDFTTNSFGSGGGGSTLHGWDY